MIKVLLVAFAGGEAYFNDVSLDNRIEISWKDPVFYEAISRLFINLPEKTTKIVFELQREEADE